MRRLWILLIAAAGIWIAALIQSGQPLGWDEIEFFRATRWTGQGLVPFRDFWEHHTPLQWMLFAPVARLAGNGPGASAVVAMRWAEVGAWLGIFAILFALRRRAGIDRTAFLAAAALLLVSPTFVRNALEFRVDVLGNLAWLAGLLLATGAITRIRGVLFGVVMSAAVLANMRLAPLVIVTALLLLFWRAPERRWGWNRNAFWMIVGVAGPVALFFGWLRLTGATAAFMQGVLRYNLESGRLLEVHTFLITLLAPISEGDPAGVVYWLLGLAGTVLVVRDLRQPGPLQFLAVQLVASIATVAAMEVQYPYHFQTAWLLILPLAAAALARLLPKWSIATAAVVVVSLLLEIVPLFDGTFGEAMRYQDLIMRTADGVTRPDEAVWDGCGYALQRRPASSYWFLPTGIRLLAARGRVAEPYDPTLDPPAAVIYNLRLLRWFEVYPRTSFFVVHHYVPRYQNLWVPGLSAAVPPHRRVKWTMVRDGVYDIWASELLLRHPWFRKPLEYAATPGPQAERLAIPLGQLPPVPAEWLQWRVDGKELAVGTRRVRLARGAHVELLSSAPREIGVLVVPAGLTEIGRGPAVKFEF